MITLDFLIVPLVLTIGGVLTLLISIFGLFAVAREVILRQSIFFPDFYLLCFEDRGAIM